MNGEFLGVASKKQSSFRMASAHQLSSILAWLVWAEWHWVCVSDENLDSFLRLVGKTRPVCFGLVHRCWLQRPSIREPWDTGIYMPRREGEDVEQTDIVPADKGETHPAFTSSTPFPVMFIHLLCCA